MPVRLFVGNLPYDATEADVRDFFATVAAPVQVFLPIDRETGRPRGFAFVEFAERADAETAIERFNSQAFKGRTISVSEARARESRPPGVGGASSYGSRPPGAMGGRPMGGPPSGRPPMGSPSGAPRSDRPFRSGPPFGAPPPDGGFDEGRRRRGPKPPTAAARTNRQEKERGPIPIRGGGRFYSVDDDDQASGDEAGFDNFATSEPPDDSEKE
ncbi:MAG: hypothetical protein U0Q12_06945 [Vicinamibacterales bacterium]